MDTDRDLRTNLQFSYGTTGDIPFVDDFNYDGNDDYGIFRDGVWYVDTDRDHRTDLKLYMKR